MSLQLPANERLTAWGLSLRVSRELARDVLLAEAPAPPPENLEEAVQAYLAERNIRTQSELRRWMQEQQISKADLEAVAMRQLHWLMVCETQCGSKLASHFLERKSRLDQVSYSLCEVADEGLAHEFYLRLKEAEVSFEQLQQSPPAGVKAERLGPVALADLPNSLAQVLRVSRPGQLWSPRQAASGWVIIRLEEFSPAVLDQPLRRQLLFELGESLIPAPAQPAQLQPAAPGEGA